MTKIPIELLKKWLPRTRWWPYLEASSVSIHEEWIEDNILFLILGYGDDKYYLPLCSIGRPSFLPKDRFLHVGEQVFYEAEYSPNYIPVLDKSEVIEKKYYGVEGFSCRIKRVYPVTLESTNVVVVHEGDVKVFVKSYRRISGTNPEPLFFDMLTRRNYKYIPRLYAMYLWKNTPVTLVTEYIPGVGDGGKPFYDALARMLRGKDSGLCLGLASLLGVEIAELHRTIAESNDDFFKPEEISRRDLEKWISSVHALYKKSLTNLEKLVTIDDYRYLEYWLELFSKIAPFLIEEFTQLIEKQAGLKKMRIHNDLHLAQFIYSERRGFILTDFEGEPGRSGEEKIMKAPVFRDIASMIRSFHYLAFACLRDYLNLSIDELGKKIVKENKDPTLEWRNTHLKALISSYIADIAPVSHVITGIRPSRILSQFSKHLIPWVIERGFYEVFYESSYGRDLIPVPIVGLYEVYGFLGKKQQNRSLD